MLNWNRASIDYHRDTFLLGPVILFSMLGIVNIVAPESPAHRAYGFELAGCAIIGVLLAKERVVVLLAGAGFVALKLGLALAMTRNWKACALGFLVFIVIIFALLLADRGKPSYEPPPRTNGPRILFGVAGLVAAVIVVLLLKPE
ncbi:MAG: hypothetical protein ABSG16_15865 [Candidatus Acidiferrum sp.]|jgi:hypothetical protein